MLALKNSACSARLPQRQQRASVRVAASAKPTLATAAKPAPKANLAAAAAAASALAVAIAPAAQAAQEAMMVAEGEPAIVQVGWAAVCVMFSFSLSLVVWGRSGM